MTRAGGETVAGLIKTTGGVVTVVVEATDGATVGLVKQGVKDTGEIMQSGTDTVVDVAETSKDVVKSIIGATAGTVTKTAEASGSLLDVATKLPGIIQKIEQKGGGLRLLESDPSGTSTVLLFGVAVLAFGGYVLYMIRKTIYTSRNDRQDDSPPDPRTVRKPIETGAR